MQNSKKAIALIICLIMTLTLLAACGNNGSTTQESNAPASSSANQPQSTPSAAPALPSASAAQPTSGDQSFIQAAPTDESVKYAEHLEVLLDSNLSVINPCSPAGSSGTANTATYAMIYDRLIEYDKDAAVHVPALATRWETDDWQTFRFYLRDDVYFHNGDKFTAQDVVNTVEIAREAPGTIISTNLSGIATATAIEEYTVEFVLDSVNVYFLFNIDLSIIGMLNKRAIEADSVEGFYIGTGPYKVTDFSTNDYVSFERNDDYWGVLPITKTQTWRYLPEVSTRAIRLQNKEAHVAMQVATGDIKFFRDSPDFVTFAVLQNDSHSVQFNMKDPICSDLNFRLAVVHALDREACAIVAMEDMYILPTDGSPGWGYITPMRNTSIPLISQDLDLARKYLADSIYNGEVIEITTARIDNVRAMEAAQEQLAKIGIKASVNEMDQASFLAFATGLEENGQILFWPQVLSADQRSYRSIYYTKMGPNRSKYSNPKVDEMLDLVQTIINPAERETIYMELQEIIYADLPTMTLYYRALEFAAAKGVGGVRTEINTSYDFRNMYMTLDN